MHFSRKENSSNLTVEFRCHEDNARLFDRLSEALLLDFSVADLKSIEGYTSRLENGQLTVTVSTLR
jgi:hypothetical protein